MTRKWNPPWLRVVDKYRKKLSLNEIYRRAGWSPGQASRRREVQDIRLRDVTALAHAIGLEPWRLARAIIDEARYERPESLPEPASGPGKRRAQRARDSADARILDAMAGLKARRGGNREARSNP